MNKLRTALANRKGGGLVLEELEIEMAGSIAEKDLEQLGILVGHMTLRPANADAHSIPQRQHRDDNTEDEIDWAAEVPVFVSHGVPVPYDYEDKEDSWAGSEDEENSERSGSNKYWC